MPQYRGALGWNHAYPWPVPSTVQSCYRMLECPRPTWESCRCSRTTSSLVFCRDREGRATTPQHCWSHFIHLQLFSYTPPLSPGLRKSWCHFPRTLLVSSAGPEATVKYSYAAPAAFSIKQGFIKRLAH